MSTTAGGEAGGGLSTLRADGSRRWIKPRLSHGRWLNRRRVVGYGLIAIFVTLPHLRIAGKPPLLLDVMHREFTFFGITLYPTDTFLLALLMISVFLSLFFLTALFGRVWCGWVCPQTVYLELVFRPIERFFHGAPGKKQKTGSWRKPARLAVYVVLAFLLANTFLAYFVGTDALRVWMTRSPIGHPISFAIVAAVTLLMLFDFGFFREQMCIVACPYGRMQSVMLDRDSLVVGYDRVRGEPRGKMRGKKPPKGDVSLTTLPAEEQRGDCIDCHMCVTTCPTGIDIRNGLQLECVNCTQCIDACDAVMDKIGKPRGLIRYSSQRMLEEGVRHPFRPRLVVYPMIIAVFVTLIATMIVTREPAFVSVLRGPGLPFQVLPDGRVANVVKVKIHDRTRDGGSYRLSVVGVPGATIEGTDNLVTLTAGEQRTDPMTLSLPAEAIPDGRVDLFIRVERDDGFTKDVPYRVLGPEKRVGAAR